MLLKKSFRDYHMSWSALFDRIKEGGLIASSSFTTYEIVEHDNEHVVDGLQNRVSILKRLTTDIHEVVGSQNRSLDHMGNDMDASRGMQDVDYVREASRSQITENHVNSDHARKIERFNDDSVWSPPWTTKETSTKANAAETVGVVAAAENICSKSEVCRNEGPNAKSDHIGTSFMAAENKACVLIENGRIYLHFYYEVGQFDDLPGR